MIILSFNFLSGPAISQLTYGFTGTPFLLGRNSVKKKTFPREDYHELLEWTVIYLGGAPEDSREFHFRKPGAVHHARFMAQSIYLLKIELLSDSLNMSQEER